MLHRKIRLMIFNFKRRLDINHFTVKLHRNDNKGRFVKIVLSLIYGTISSKISVGIDDCWAVVQSDNLSWS